MQEADHLWTIRVYVALSRARNLQGLKVLRLAQNMARGSNPEVRQFLETHFGTNASRPDRITEAIGLIDLPDPWQKWRSEVDEAFADYSGMREFPCPPVGLCSKMSCSADKSRVLPACRCNIKAAFTKLEDLRKERSRWHPDRFSRLPEEKRDLFQKMAMEVFVVVDSMWRRAEMEARR